MPPELMGNGRPLEDMSVPSLPEVIAKALSLLGVQSLNSAAEQMTQDLKDWNVNRQAKMSAAKKSYEEEKAASYVRAVTQVASGVVCVAGAALQLGLAGNAAKNQWQAGQMEAPAKLELKDAKGALNEVKSQEVPSPADETAALGRVNQARQELSDKQYEVAPLRDRAVAFQRYAETVKSVERAGTSSADATSQAMATPHDVSKKAQDLSGQMSDGNAQVSMDMAQRRRGDMNDARKRFDELNQMLVEMARVNARNVLA
jgi:myosin heavy subunit